MYVPLFVSVGERLALLMLKDLEPDMEEVTSGGVVLGAVVLPGVFGTVKGTRGMVVMVFCHVVREVVEGELLRVAVDPEAMHAGVVKLIKPPLLRMTRLGLRACSWLRGTSWISCPLGFRYRVVPEALRTGCRTILRPAARGVRGMRGVGVWEVGGHAILTELLVPGSGSTSTGGLVTTPLLGEVFGRDTSPMDLGPAATEATEGTLVVVVVVTMVRLVVGVAVNWAGCPVEDLASSGVSEGGCCDETEDAIDGSGPVGLRNLPVR